MAEIENLSIVLSANAQAAIAEIDKLASALGKFSTASRNAGGAAKQTGDEVKDMGTATAQAGKQTGEAAEKAEIAANKFAGIGAALKGFGSKISSIAKGIGIAGKAFTAIPGYFGGKFVDSIKSATASISHFFGMVKRVAMMRMIRAALKFITHGIQQGMKNLYAWSSAVNGEFARSMNTLSTASQYAGNSIAAMASPLINALAPAIDFVVDKLVDMFNLFNQIFARLSGQTSYTAAKKVASQWQDASESASGSASRAADKIKRTILGFDEINKLNGDNDTGGGGGGGSGGGSSGAGMFETRQIDGAVSTFVDQIRAAFEAGDWQGLGTTLGTKINDIVNSIDFASAGRTVGYYINGWFSTKYWTLETINFTNIGKKIAEFLNNAIGQIDFNILGRSLVQKMGIIGDTIIGFFTDFDWGQAAASFQAFVTGMFNGITDWFKKHDWNELGETLYTKVSDALANIDFGELASSFFTMLGTAINAAIRLGAGFIGSLWSDIADWWNENIAADTFSDTVANILDAIGQGFSNIGQWVFDNIIDPFIAALTGHEDWKEIAVEIAVSLVKKVGEWATDVWSFLQNTGATIAKTVKAGFEAAKTFAGNVWDSIVAGAETITKTVKAVADSAAAFAKSLWAWIMVGAETIEKKVSAVAESAAAFAKSLWTWIMAGGETIVKTVSALASSAATFANSLWTWIRGGAETVAKTVEAGMQKAASWSDSIMDFFVGEGSIFRDLYLSMYGENGTDFGNYVTTKLNGLIESIKTWWRDLWTSLWEEIKSIMPDWMKKLLGIESTSTSGDHTIPLIDPDNPSGGAGRSTGITIPVEYAPADGAIEGLAAETLTFWDLLSPEERTVATQTAIGTAVTTVASGFKTKWNKLEEAKKLLGFGGTVSTGAATVASGFKTSWDKLTDSVKNLGFTGSVATGASTVASNFLGVWRELNTGKTLSFEGKVGTSAKTVANAFANDAWSKLGDNPKTVRFIGMVGTAVDKVAKTFKTDFKDNVSDAQKTLPFLGKVATKASAMAADYKTSWGDLSESKKKLGFFGKLKTASDSPSPSTLFKANSTFDYKGVLKKGWAADKTPQQVLGVDNLTTDIEVGFTTRQGATSVSVTGGGGGRWTLMTQALGGIFSNGIWSAISQFANGGVVGKHGSLFLAGEAGPEIVGHVGGRTEVLNQSQLAAAMYSAVHSAMNGVSLDATFYNDNSEQDYEAMYNAVYDAMAAALAKGEALDRDRNNILREINSKEFSQEFSTSGLTQSLERKNRRAGTTVVPVMG